ncbi:Nascent polypeptide-associated complex protein [Candidatus Micrarchaeota archaeon]|nr:Nascent polypeptide-associated complex protein [Candidatus Micrarchaeota archaeon]
MDPKQLASMMKQMGIKNEQIPSEKVEIIKEDGSKIIVENPQVILIEMRGQKSFQISGDVSEEEAGGQKETDADIIAKETGCSKEEAETALKEAGGDLAEAIMSLKEQQG